MKVNLWDAAFSHVAYSVPGRISKHIEWVRGKLDWDGITVVTDGYLREGHIFDNLKSRATVGWLLEGRGYANANYEVAERHIGKLDLLLTHDAYLLAKYPGKCRLVPFGGCWIPDDAWGMHEKTRLVSHIYSSKNFMEGHRLRHEIGRRYSSVDHYGTGTQRPLTRKEDGLRAYKFSIVVENDRAQNYFTEKLLDCFALGTIPIYWGCPNIGAFFNPLGIMRFADLDELRGTLISLMMQDYEEFREAAQDNMERARQYVLPEDYIYNVLSHEGFLI